MIRPFSACLVLVLVAGSVRATGPHAATAPVPPTQEIELLDPGVDPTGKPTAIVRPDPNNPGLQQVDVPPAILVHKFYYTGDRTFQGPMLPGGPTIAALNHPKTGERTYVNIVADHVHDASQMVLLPVVNGLKSLPGAQLLQSTPEAQAEKARDKAARQAERMPNPDSAFIKRP